MSDAAAGEERLRILAHELRSPVAALVALAGAARDVPDPARRRRVVELAVAAARDVDRLLSDPELMSLRVETVDLAALAAGFASDDVEVRAGREATVEADPTRLRQLLGNLVANGLRHGTRVEIDVVAGDGEVVVDVSDDGPGLSSEPDPFARGASGIGSTGYGLWLARAVAEAHGGSLAVVPGAPGTRLRLIVPSASAGR